MVKLVTLLLIVLAVLAMFGRLRLKLPRRKPPPQVGKARLCPDCGRLLVGKGGCDCGAPPHGKG